MSMLEVIAEERKNLLPTPPVPHDVAWYDRGDESVPYAAIVTKVEGPGRVCLTIFKPNALPVHKSGVRYHTDKEVQDKHSATVQHCGIWSYPGKAAPPKAHLDFHKEELDRRELGFMKDQEALEQAAKARAEKAASTPKKPPIELATA